MLMVIPVSIGETYTAYSDSIGEYDPTQESITLDQLKALGEANDVDTNIDDMTPRERFMWLVEDVGYYCFTHLAVVDESKMCIVEETADMVTGNCSSDFLMFNRVVISIAEKVIPFYGDVIEVDPDY